MKSKTVTGYSKKTKEYLQLNAGVIMKNYDPDNDTYASARAAGKIIGATSGGSEFKAAVKGHDVAVDGIPGKAKGLFIIEEWEVSLATTFIETTAETIKLSLGAVNSESVSSPTGYTKITGKNQFDDSDYLDNIAFLGSLSGSEDPVIVIVKNALSTDGLDLKVEDKKEGTVPATFYGYYEDDGTGDFDEPPFEILYPPVEIVTATPETAAFDKKTTAANYKDLTFTVSGGTVTAVKNGSSTLMETTNYTISSSVVTIKKEYLASLSTGTATLTFVTADGNVTVSITITQSA